MGQRVVRSTTVGDGVSVTDGPAPLGRRERKRADTRGRLHRAGLELFAAQGVATTTVNDIAERADVAERTFYRYFDSKEDLLLDDVRRYFTVAAAFVGSRPDTEAPITSLLEAVGALAEDWNVADAEVVWLAELITDDPSARGHLHRLVDEYQEELAQIFARRRGLVEADYRSHLEAAVAGTAFIQAIGRFLVSDAAPIEQYGIEAIRFYAAGVDPAAAKAVAPLHG
jgi:AcrR family transcriptional regulator